MNRVGFSLSIKTYESVVGDINPFIQLMAWNVITDEDRLRLKAKENPELAKHLDRHYDGEKKISLSANFDDLNFNDKNIEYFVDTYTYRNDTIDKIILGKDGEPYCIDSQNYEVFDDNFPYTLSYLAGSDSVNLNCEKDKDNPGQHFVLNTTHFNLQ